MASATAGPSDWAPAPQHPRRRAGMPPRAPRILRFIWLAFFALAGALHLRAAPLPQLQPAAAPSIGMRHALVTMADEGPGGGEERGSGSDTKSKRKGRRGLSVWNRIRGRVKESEAEPDTDTVELLEGVAQEIDTALATRRRRLRAKLGSSLKNFRGEVLNEVELQASEAKERQERLRSRQATIQESLKNLREDLLDEIEEGLAGVKRGGQTLERALTDMRETWEAEVNELVNEAKTDVRPASGPRISNGRQSLLWASSEHLWALRSSCLRPARRHSPMRRTPSAWPMRGAWLPPR